MRSLGVALSLVLMAASAACADSYPTRSVKMIVPFAAGSGADVIMRMLAQRLSDAFAQPFIVENKPGAGGMIGVDAVAKAAPDGYTLVYASNTTLAAAPHIFKHVPYDPANDLVPIAITGFLPTVMLALPSFPAKNFESFLAYAKANPGKLSYAYAHATGLAAGASMKMFANIDMIGIPYKSSPQAMTDLLGGQVPIYFSDLVTALPVLRDNKVTAFGVTAAKRSDAIPNVPTIGELLPGVDGIFGWGVLAAPAKTPAAIVTRLNKEVSRIMRTPELKEFMAKIGADWMDGTPQDVMAFVQTEMEKWARVLKGAGVQPE